jgi:hypothetical protein
MKLRKEEKEIQHSGINNMVVIITGFLWENRRQIEKEGEGRSQIAAWRT